MHTVDKNNVIERNDKDFKSDDASSSYTSILNSTRRERSRNRTNRFYYSAGDFNFLFEQNLKVENLPQTTINKVPHAPKWCDGIISVRGIIMPVVNLHSVLKKEFDLPSTVKSSNSHLLMIEHKNHAPIILQIDKLPESVNIKNYTRSNASKNSPDWLECTWKNYTNKLFEVNHDKLFNKIRTIK